VEVRTSGGVRVDNRGKGVHYVPVPVQEMEGLRGKGRQDENPYQKPKDGLPATGSVMRSGTH